MTRPCANECPEPVAELEPGSGVTIEEWEANLHFHDGCVVGHVGKVCAIQTTPEDRMKKPKQEDLPGQEPQPKIKAVHEAIEAYVELRDERMRLTELGGAEAHPSRGHPEKARGSRSTPSTATSPRSRARRRSRPRCRARRRRSHLPVTERRAVRRTHKEEY